MKYHVRRDNTDYLIVLAVTVLWSCLLVVIRWAKYLCRKNDLRSFFLIIFCLKNLMCTFIKCLYVTNKH